ncbi:MAG: hypothetical protein IKO48_07130 [Elusimicrobia bacterium]|nr:hypothetical protein [Elusimicrobiota bacterium]
MAVATDLALLGGSTLSSFLSGMFGSSEADKQRAQLEASKRRARAYLKDYGYEEYNSPYEDFFNNLIQVYGTGNLTKGQQQQLNQAANEGASSIATVMANRGGTIGGQLAATEKFNNDLASQRLALSDQNVNTALNLANTRDQFNLSDWLNQQQAGMRQKELLAQYS